MSSFFKYIIEEKKYLNKLTGVHYSKYFRTQSILINVSEKSQTDLLTIDLAYCNIAVIN